MNEGLYKWGGFYLLLIIVLILMVILSSCAAERFYTPGLVDKSTFSGLPEIEEVKETFVSRFTQQTDILAVIDNSGSMDAEIKAVKDNFGVFHSKLNSDRLNDYRIALASTDAWEHQGVLKQYNGIDIVDPNTVDPVATMKGLLGTLVDSKKSYWEQGLKSMELAIRMNQSRLLRPGVDLAVILITDEEDYSCMDMNGLPTGRECPGMASGLQPQDISPRNWQSVGTDYYKSYLQSLQRSVLLYPMVGLPNLMCQEFSDGTRYLSLRDLLGTGFSSPICTTNQNDPDNILPKNILKIAEQISSRGDCYRLSRHAEPPVSDIIVKIGASVIPADKANGYTYDAATNAVCFSGLYLPGAGATLEVTYRAVKR